AGRASPAEREIGSHARGAVGPISRGSGIGPGKSPGGRNGGISRGSGMPAISGGPPGPMGVPGGLIRSSISSSSKTTSAVLWVRSSGLYPSSTATSSSASSSLSASTSIVPDWVTTSVMVTRYLGMARPSLRPTLTSFRPHPLEHEADVVQSRDERGAVTLPRRRCHVAEADDFGSGEPEPDLRGRVHHEERQAEVATLHAAVADEHGELPTGPERASAVPEDALQLLEEPLQGRGV